MAEGAKYKLGNVEVISKAKLFYTCTTIPQHKTSFDHASAAAAQKQSVRPAFTRRAGGRSEGCGGVAGCAVHTTGIYDFFAIVGRQIDCGFSSEDNNAEVAEIINP